MPNQSTHYFQLMEAAAPYLGQNMQKQIRLMIQANELLNSVHAEPSEFSALEASKSQPDMEQMLEHILPVCNASEQAMVNRILNTLRAGRMFRAYQSFQNHQGNTGNSNNTGAGNSSSTGNNSNNPQFQDFLMTQLSPEQQETLKTFQSILSNQAL